VDSECRIEAAALRDMIAKDRAAQIHPICVIGNAGTINTGATDDLRTLARTCREEGLWFHIDGAFGALAQWSERLKPGVAGLAEADSLAFDLHKWMYQPFTVACLLVRDNMALDHSFAMQASYLAPTQRGVCAGGLQFADRGIELTREFRALKVWMSMKAHGVRAITRVIEQNVEQAQTLANLVDEHPELERLASVPLNVVCFRYAPAAGRGDVFWNRVNQELLLRLQESGLAVPSSTVLQGRFAIRCIFVNHRTRSADIRILVAAVVRLGREVCREMH
jgi:glutamate/tyrosine decarboxylase-like PLP-dependent enzyme